MIKKIDKLSSIISDSSKMKAFKDELAVKILELNERKEKLENQEINYDINKSKLESDISELETLGLNAIDSSLAKVTKRVMEEELEKLYSKMKEAKQLELFAKDSLTMLTNRNALFEFYDKKINNINLLEDINILRVGGEVGTDTVFMKITLDQICDTQVKKDRNLCKFFNIILDQFKDYKMLPEYLLKYLVNINPSDKNSIISKYNNMLKANKKTLFSEVLLSHYSEYLNKTYLPKIKTQISEYEPVIISAKDKLETLNDSISVKTQQLNIINSHHESHDQNLKSLNSLIEKIENDVKQFDSNSKFHNGIRAMINRTYETLKTIRNEYISDFEDEKKKDCVNKLTSLNLLEGYKNKLLGLIQNGKKYDEIKNLLIVKYEENRSIMNEVFNFEDLGNIQPTIDEINTLLLKLNEVLNSLATDEKVIEQSPSGSQSEQETASPETTKPNEMAGGSNNKTRQIEDDIFVFF